MYDVICIGAATVDIFVKSDNLIVSDNFIGIERASKNEINESLICSGGGATNSAVAFSRLGLKSTCISLIGSSHLNGYIFEDLQKDNISPNFIIQDDNDSTDFSVILVGQDGSRSILTNRGHGGLQEKHIDWTNIKDTKWFYISSIEGNLDLLEKLIGFAKENNIKVALNPGKRELSQPQKLLPLLKLIDFLLLNQEEAEIITQSDSDNSHFWENIESLTTPIIGITNGRQGAHVLFNHQQFYSPAVDTIPIDETGAGDSFGATFITALVHQKNPKEALFWAVKNSASVVSHLGAKSGLLILAKIQ